MDTCASVLPDCRLDGLHRSQPSGCLALELSSAAGRLVVFRIASAEDEIVRMRQRCASGRGRPRLKARARASTSSRGVIGLVPAEDLESSRSLSNEDMPPFNVLIAGPTGAGKSTLINAILRKPVAKTGKGRPVTADIQAWTVDGVPITVYDTPGLELNDEDLGRDEAHGQVPQAPAEAPAGASISTSSGTARCRTGAASRTLRRIHRGRRQVRPRRSSCSRSASAPTTRKRTEYRSTVRALLDERDAQRQRLVRRS